MRTFSALAFVAALAWTVPTPAALGQVVVPGVPVAQTAPSPEAARAKAALALAQISVSLPQSTIDVTASQSSCPCGCAAGKPCVCPDCPDGKEADYSACLKLCEADHKPIVVFVGVPKRTITGCRVLRCDEFGAPAIIVGVWNGIILDRHDLSCHATDAEILAVRPTTAHAAIVGEHSHRCSRCGTEWSHGADSYGSVAAHSCPSCGAVTWAVAHQGPARNATPAPQLLSMADSPVFNCPT